MEIDSGLVFSTLIYKPHYLNAVRVNLYADDTSMYEAAQKWNKERKNKYSFDNDYDALTLENLPNETVGDNLVFCTIFLNQKNLTKGILMHEFIHATFCYFRSILRYDMKFEPIRGTGDDAEEIFCYTAEGFFSSYLTKLKENDIEL